MKVKVSLSNNVLKAKISEGKSTGKPIAISTPEEMNQLLIIENVGKIYKYIGETNGKYTKDSYYLVEKE